MVVGLAVLALWACRSPVAYHDGLYRGREAPYTIAGPPGPEGSWSRVRVAKADLAFRGPRGETMSLAGRCTSALAPPRILARHLRFQLPEHHVRETRERPLAGAPGWEQVLELRGGEAALTIATVTLVWRGCILDLILVVPEAAFAPARSDFEAWLGTLRLEGGPAPGEAS